MPLALLHKPIYRRRISVLSELIFQHLQNNDRVLDVGSGFGELAKKIEEKASGAGLSVEVKGLEKYPRGNEKVPTITFDGYKIPCGDAEYDVVILADVVHHEEDYMKLLKEVERVSSRYVIIKDHLSSGFLGYQRVCFMDWAANNPYGVKCLYRYFSLKEWSDIYSELDLHVEEELTSIRLYQEPFNIIFGNKLQYMSVLSKNTNKAAHTNPLPC